MPTKRVPFRFTPVFSLLIAVLLLNGCDNGFWSPDSKQLAIDVGGKLNIVDAASGAFTTFNCGGRHVLNPIYSPDGKTLAYFAGTQLKGGIRWGIWLRDLQTSRERQLPNWELSSADTPMAMSALKNWLPLGWSPDSEQLTYLQTDQNHDFFPEIHNLSTGLCSTPLGHHKDIQFVQWSPDGKMLAFTRATDPNATGHTISALDLYVAAPDGRNVKRLWRSTSKSGMWPFGPPIWTSKSDGLLFLTTRPEDAKERMWSSGRPMIARFAPCTGGLVRSIVTLQTAMGMVSPDMKAAVYIGVQKGQTQASLLYRPAPFTTVRVLDKLQPAEFPSSDPTAATLMDPHPLISPDGKTIALLPTLNAKSKKNELRLYDAATGGKRVLAIPFPGDAAPRLRP